MQLMKIVEGRTLELDPFVCLVQAPGEANASPFNFTGFTTGQVKVKLRTQKGVAVVAGGTIRFGSDRTKGEIYYTPVVADFQATFAPYFVHIEVTDGAGKVVHFPEDKPDIIAVYAA